MARLTAFPEEQIIEKIKFENPWWQAGQVDNYYNSMKRRLYFGLFRSLVRQNDIRRAVVLMGPRRVGKTVMVYHLIQDLINDGANPRKICYLSIDNPIYSGLSLEFLLKLYQKAVNDHSSAGYYLIFDEIQYLKDWERHLKTLVDGYYQCNFIASGSAAAALKLKSNESGAGRFTDFILPPLTFHEYVNLKGLDNLITPGKKEWNNIEKNYFNTTSIEELNKHFVNYINYGGYPELSLSAEMQLNPGRYIRADIIDKVLLRDLPSLYGIQDVQELNALFSTIAYNSGNEFTLEDLSITSGIAKNTIRKYITYLEAAFLIRVIHRIDINAKKFKRANFFKIYLTNPSLRTALFSPIGASDEFIGNMVETAIFSQWSHNYEFTPYYARWATGEVDMVGLNSKFKPLWAVEVKWSNRYVKSIQKLGNLHLFCVRNNLSRALITTLDIEEIKQFENLTYDFTPSSVYCYNVGKNAVESKLTGAF